MRLFKVIETSFETFDNTIRNYLTRTLGSVGANFSRSQIFNTIFEGVKGVIQNALFYIEDALTEQNIETAYRKTSIYSLAKISGYEPYYGSAAVGLLDCQVVLSNNLPSDSTKIYIKNGARLINNTTGFQYVTYLPTDFMIIDLSKPLVKTQFKVIQGVWKSNSYVAYGEPLETVHITTNGFYDNEYVEVTVNGEKYTPAACLYDMTPDSKEFVISTGYDNELDIMFGNGVHGKQLKENQTVMVRYISHNGVSGNIAIDDVADFEFNDSLTDGFGEVVKGSDHLILSLGSSISGGSNSDTIADVRQMIGYNSRSLVLASENNFKLFFKRFSFIGHSNIWCTPNSLNVNACCLANVDDLIHSNMDYFSITDSKLLLTDSQKQMVIDTLNNSNKAFAGITLNFIDPIIRKFAIIAYVKAPNDFNRDTVKIDINNSIAEYFINLPSNTLFIAKSDIISKVINDVKYIESFDITFVSDAEELGFINNKYVTYEEKKVNGEITYVKVTKPYDSGLNIGLDEFGNIELDTKFEVPMLSDGVHYRNSDHNSRSVFEEAITVLFI